VSVQSVIAAAAEDIAGLTLALSVAADLARADDAAPTE
jgi:hypothetical protein